jgi:predicted ribosome quality control (RQC) complex YloA/Tae2 family protein
MTSLVNNNLELQKQKNQFDELQRQILSIKNMQEEDQQKVAGILSNIKAIEKDINTTQELQRLQAQKLSPVTIIFFMIPLELHITFQNGQHLHGH